MKFKEIQEMSTDELTTKKRDLRQESLHLRLQQKSGQLEQPSRLRLLRRQAAQVETVLTSAREEDGDEIIFMADETQTPTATAEAPAKRGTRKTRTGEVISSGMNKTIVVRTTTRVPHRKFGKIVKQMREILRARRGEQSQDGRHSSHHGNAAAEQIETLAVGGSGREVISEQENFYGPDQIETRRGG